jgi:hypothetical protein
MVGESDNQANQSMSHNMMLHQNGDNTYKANNGTKYFLHLTISSNFTSDISRIYDWISGSVCCWVSMFELK